MILQILFTKIEKYQFRAAATLFLRGRSKVRAIWLKGMLVFMASLVLSSSHLVLVQPMLLPHARCAFRWCTPNHFYQPGTYFCHRLIQFGHISRSRHCGYLAQLHKMECNGEKHWGTTESFQQYWDIPASTYMTALNEYKDMDETHSEVVWLVILYCTI